MNLVEKTDIQEYAKKNTSSKMPIEAKYIEAFLDALFNSTLVQEKYQILKDEIQNGDSFIIFNSFHKSAQNVNKEPFRSIIAYSMLKKDIRLFEFISASLFTGSVTEYHGVDLYSEMIKNTDETPTKYTDSDIYTDMSEGLIQIGFKNIYCNDPLPDGSGSEYQTIEELQNALENFDTIITLTKPARVEILTFLVPYMYLSGNAQRINSCGINVDDDNFSSPFGDPVSMNIIAGLTIEQLSALYSSVSMYDYTHSLELNITFTKTISKTPGFLIFDYDFRCIGSSSSESTVKDIIWGNIKIQSNTQDKIFSRKFNYQTNEEYFEKYNPIMLRINDDDPNGPCLALEIENSIPTIGAMFYVRDKI